MGQIERMAEADEGLRIQMEDVLVQAKAAVRCDHHTLILKGDELAERGAYAIATKRYKEDDIPDASSLEQVRRAVKGAIEMAADFCPSCDKYRQG